MASSKFVNTFMLGADPELVLLNPPNLHRAGRDHNNDETGYFGFDHGGYVLEPHPLPHPSARQVCNNIRNSLDFMYYKYHAYRFRAGAYVDAPQRHVTLGGHVHLDMPALSRDQIQAMDIFADSLVSLDILPRNECARRCESGEGYGRKSDVRAERGRVEYRSMCSWLFSRKTSMLAITGIKLCAVAPQTLPKKGMTSIKELSTWLEGFKDSDDDVRWILDKDYFGKSMEAQPDAVVTDVWKCCPERGKALLDDWIEKTIVLKKSTSNLVAEVGAEMTVAARAAMRRALRNVQQEAAAFRPPVNLRIPQREPVLWGEDDIDAFNNQVEG